jgi:hypothetical protein
VSWEKRRHASDVDSKSFRFRLGSHVFRPFQWPAPVEGKIKLHHAIKLAVPVEGAAWCGSTGRRKKCVDQAAAAAGGLERGASIGSTLKREGE